MNVLRKGKSNELFLKANRLIDSNLIIVGIRVNGLERIDEKNWQGVSKLFLSRGVGTILGMTVVAGSKSLKVFAHEGMEIYCVSKELTCF